MRFKNYRNKYNNQNRIFSEDDVFDMTLGSFFDNENDLLAQNREIGVPSVEELRNSQNTKWVEPFVNDKGINDGGYWQSVLDENQTPQILESFAPKNNIEQLAYNSQNEPQYTLEGAIQHNVIQPIQNLVENIQNSYSTKYEGLTPKAVIQKAAAKLPIWKSSAKEYYQHALKRADGEEPTDFMKEQNDFKKIHEIYDPNLRQMFINKAAKMYDLDVNDPATYDAVKDTEVVFPKLGSQLNSQIKESKNFQKWVAENYENIKNQTNKNESMIFAPSFFHWGENGLFATINNTDLKTLKSMKMVLFLHYYLMLMILQT